MLGDVHAPHVKVYLGGGGVEAELSGSEGFWGEWESYHLKGKEKV